MSEISRFFGIVISMYYREHFPPHFHAKYGEYKAGIKIDDFAIFEGNLPPRALGMIIEWAAQHKDELASNWNAVQDKKPLLHIDPLK